MDITNKNIIDLKQFKRNYEIEWHFTDIIRIKVKTNFRNDRIKINERAENLGLKYYCSL